LIDGVPGWRAIGDSRLQNLGARWPVPADITVFAIAAIRAQQTDVQKAFAV
jgi:hypothetical protein